MKMVNFPFGSATFGKRISRLGVMICDWKKWSLAINGSIISGQTFVWRKNWLEGSRPCMLSLSQLFRALTPAPTLLLKCLLVPRVFPLPILR